MTSQPTMPAKSNRKPAKALPSIYGLLHPETRELRYIGKANDPLGRLKGHLKETRRRSPLYDWIGSLPSPPILEVMYVCKPEEDWRDIERMAIAHGRKHGVRLLNIADGGDEPYCSREVRAANGAKNARARQSTPEKRKRWRARQMLGLALSQGYASEATKLKILALSKIDPKTWGQFAAIISA